jgi:excinuclease ABC subunit C
VLRTQDLKTVPARPGVYILKNKQEKIVYIGKSANLKERLRSYTREESPFPRNILVRNVVSFEVIPTTSEVEALVLEDNLIKLNKPKFNIRLKDDKKFPYLKITVNERFPRIFPTRNLKPDGSILFGPYTNAKNLRRAVRAIQKIFKIRTCARNLPTDSPQRPCLNFLMKRCLGVCQNTVPEEIYRERINNAISFLRGKSTEVEAELEKKMKLAAQKEDFETAALYRDEFLALRDIIKNQEPVFTDIRARDILGIARSDNFYQEAKSKKNYANVTLIKIRGGKIIGKENYPFILYQPAENYEIIESLMREIYLHTYDVPDEIILPCELKTKNVFYEWFRKERKKTVKIYYPKRGLKKRLLKLANTDAEIGLSEIVSVPKTPQSLIDLQKYLLLPQIPKTIEGVDISNIGGKFACGSIVVFKNGFPDKQQYRLFRIRTVQGPNDYAMLEEVLRRRVHHLTKKNQSLPDLVLIDGGKGQLAVAEKVYRESPQPPILLAFAKRTDTLYYSSGQEVSIPAYSPALKLLKRIRNEAHRFAIKYHKKLRAKSLKYSILDEIRGIGKKRKTVLLRHFGSIEEIKSAPITLLQKLPGFNLSIAQQLKEEINRLDSKSTIYDQNSK